MSLVRKREESIKQMLQFSGHYTLLIFLKTAVPPFYLPIQDFDLLLLSYAQKIPLYEFFGNWLILLIVKSKQYDHRQLYRGRRRIK